LCLTRLAFSVEVRITPEDLVVLSFPGPDRSIKLADLRKGRAVSRRYRNRRIGEFLKELDLTEGRSAGISKIITAMVANGSPLPEFESDDDRSHFLICLPVHEKVAELEAEKSSVKSSKKTTQESTQKTKSGSEKSVGEKVGEKRLDFASFCVFGGVSRSFGSS